MSKKSKYIKVLSSTAILASVAVPVMAAESTVSYSGVVLKDAAGNLYSISKGEYELAIALGTLPAATVEYVEVNGKPYSMGDYGLIVALGTTGDAAFAELAETKEPVVDENIQTGKIENGQLVPADQTPGELTVESVSAINTTVYKAVADQTLKVQVNGNKEVTVEELVEAGYAVSFSANKAVFATTGTTSTTGVLANPLTVEEFNYTVTVTKGEESFTSETTGKVTVIDSSAIKTIDELELQNSSNVAQKSTTITLDDTGFKVVATKGTNIKGDEVKPVTGVTYESSNKTVALVDTNGTITPVSAGTTTIKVKSGTASKTITLTVAEATRTITTVKADVTSVDIVEGAEKSVKITAFDQFGDAIATGGLTVASAKEDIATISGTASPVKVTGVAKGSTTVTIKAGEKTISIPVTVGEAKVASHKFELVTVADQSDDTTIDVAKAKDNKVTLAYNKYNATNQLIGPATVTQYDPTNIGEGFSYEVIEKSTTGTTVSDIVDESLVGNQITLTANKAGTVTVNIYEGALKVATQTITVNDSTPTVTGATFIKDAKVTTTEETPVLKVSGLTFTSTASDAKFNDGKITNEAGTVEYGTYDLVTNLTGVTASVTDAGELALTVTQPDEAAVTGTVSVRIKDNAGKTVTVGAIDVAIAKNADAAAVVEAVNSQIEDAVKDLGTEVATDAPQEYKVAFANNTISVTDLETAPADSVEVISVVNDVVNALPAEVTTISGKNVSDLVGKTDADILAKVEEILNTDLTGKTLADLKGMEFILPATLVDGATTVLKNYTIKF